MIEETPCDHNNHTFCTVTGCSCPHHDEDGAPE